MFVLGLTGSIGMGKSATARIFGRLGVPVYDADAAVHGLLGPGGGAVAAVEAAFPGVVKNGRVDRQALGARVFGDGAALRRLEAIIHPRLGAERRRFLAAAARRRQPLVVLDIPLLFETGGEARMDATAVVSAPHRVQRQRVLRRPGMSEIKFQDILKQQVPDAVKRRRADFVISTGLGRRLALNQVRRIVSMLKRCQGRSWPPRARRGRGISRPSGGWGYARNRTRY